MREDHDWPGSRRSRPRMVLNNSGRTRRGVYDAMQEERIDAQRLAQCESFCEGDLIDGEYQAGVMCDQSS